MECAPVWFRFCIRDDIDEPASCPQTNCLAVRGITSLLLQTLTSMTPGYPEVSATLHHARDQPPVAVPGR